MQRFILLGKRKLFVLMAGMLVLHACADNPVAPTASTKAPPQPLKSISSIDPSTSEITIVDDDDGTQYTFIPATNEIRVSDGSYIELDASQAAMFAAEFQGTLEMDQIIPSMNSLTLDCTIDYNAAKPGRCPEDQRPTLIGGAQGSAQASAPQSGSAVTRTTVLWRRTTSVPADRAQLRASTAMRSTLGPVLSLSYGDPCVDVLNAGASQAAVFTRNRTTAMATARDAVVGELALRGSELVLEKTLPSGSAAAAAVITEIADRAAARIAVSILAYVWNTNSCGTHVPVAQITLGGAAGGGGGGGGGLTCHNEGWEISFDGGETWSPITVRVCQYAME